MSEWRREGEYMDMRYWSWEKFYKRDIKSEKELQKAPPPLSPDEIIAHTKIADVCAIC